MNWSSFVTDVGVPAITLIVTFILVPVFRALRNLELSVKDIKGDQRVLDEKVHHIEGNYKQGIEALNQEVTELKTDIKELLKLAYGRRAGEFKDP